MDLDRFMDGCLIAAGVMGIVTLFTLIGSLLSSYGEPGPVDEDEMLDDDEHSDSAPDAMLDSEAIDYGEGTVCLLTDDFDISEQPTKVNLREGQS